MRSAFHRLSIAARNAVTGVAVGLCAALLLYVLPGAAPIGQPASPGAAWGQILVADANTTTSYVLASANVSDVPATFGWDTLVYVSSTVEATCCWVQALGLALGSQTTALAGFVDDAGGSYPDGNGACFSLTKGSVVDDSPRQAVMARRSGRSPGVCTVASAYPIDGSVLPPCRSNPDCALHGGGGTCNLTPGSAAASSGAFLACKARTAGYVFVSARK